MCPDCGSEEHSKMSVRAIADASNVGKSTMARIIKENIKSGHCNTKSKGKCGRKREPLLMMMLFYKK